MSFKVLISKNAIGEIKESEKTSSFFFKISLETFSNCYNPVKEMSFTSLENCPYLDNKIER